jgi:hypothetical protein
MKNVTLMKNLLFLQYMHATTICLWDFLVHNWSLPFVVRSRHGSVTTRMRWWGQTGLDKPSHLPAQQQRGGWEQGNIQLKTRNYSVGIKYAVAWHWRQLLGGGLNYKNTWHCAIPGYLIWKKQSSNKWINITQLMQKIFFPCINILPASRSWQYKALFIRGGGEIFILGSIMLRVRRVITWMAPSVVG